MFSSRLRSVVGVLALAALALLMLPGTGMAQPPRRQYVKEYAVLITSIVPGSTAEQQGLEPGDIIVSVNGFRVRSMPDFRNRIQQSGGQADLTVWSLGDPGREVMVTVYPQSGKIGINGQQVELQDNSGYGRKPPRRP